MAVIHYNSRRQLRVSELRVTVFTANWMSRKSSRLESRCVAIHCFSFGIELSLQNPHAFLIEPLDTPYLIVDQKSCSQKDSMENMFPPLLVNVDMVIISQSAF